MGQTTETGVLSFKPLQRARTRHSQTIVALILREMASRYGRTPGGYLWAVVEPMGMIAMLSFGFSLLLRSPPLGGSFILFFATGHLVYALFLRTNNCVMNALSYSRNLLSYPAVTWLDVVIARFVLNALTDILVAVVLLGTIIILVDHQAVLAFGPILAAFGMAGFLGIGVGLMNCVLIGFFPVWKNIWSIVTRPLFLASGVIWIFEELPPLAQDILWWNPLIHLTGLARAGFYTTYEAQYVLGSTIVFPALILVAAGLIFMRRYHMWIISAG